MNCPLYLFQGRRKQFFSGQASCYYSWYNKTIISDNSSACFNLQFMLFLKTVLLECIDQYPIK